MAVGLPHGLRNHNRTNTRLLAHTNRFFASGRGGSIMPIKPQKSGCFLSFSPLGNSVTSLYATPSTRREREAISLFLCIIRFYGSSQRVAVILICTLYTNSTEHRELLCNDAISSRMQTMYRSHTFAV